MEKSPALIENTISTGHFASNCYIPIGEIISNYSISRILDSGNADSSLGSVSFSTPLS